MKIIIYYYYLTLKLLEKSIYKNLISFINNCNKIEILGGN